MAELTITHRQKGKQCSTKDVSCKQGQVSTTWFIDPGTPELGNWRERHGYSIFVQFCAAPRRAGWVSEGGQSFWKHTAPLACHYHPSLYCLASGLGSLYEYVCKSASDKLHPDRREMAFALHQCSRALTLLTANHGSDVSVEIALIACVLLTYFGSLQGYTSEAVLHCLQGEKLLAILDQDLTSGCTSSLVDLFQIQTVIMGEYPDSTYHVTTLIEI